MLLLLTKNAKRGYGLSKKDAQELLFSGLDVITLGNHAGIKEKC